MDEVHLFFEIFFQVEKLDMSKGKEFDFRIPTWTVKIHPSFHIFRIRDVTFRSFMYENIYF